ncbi:alpha/beta hydrolase family esterase [Corynebacterium aquatimens]|uniref:Polyhydroxybutyrate depolymerase n=1 Tax=Corynebacterium aquatimens TaxID=1190508 RepID=A0A931E0U4_9CORY|nr:polyhydroxybutyrate depolymerase [Corynebacterium aquatimens]
MHRHCEVDGLRRRYYVQVPAHTATDAALPLPLIVAFHGSGDHGESFINLVTQLYRADAVVVAPDGYRNVWAPAGYAHTTIEQDSAFIRAMVRQACESYPVDLKRIYLVGFSNGGGIAIYSAFHIFGAGEIPPAAGLFTVGGSARRVALAGPLNYPVPYTNIHGVTDSVVPYGGGEYVPGDMVVAVDEVVDIFRQRNGNDAPVDHMQVPGLGHYWPLGGQGEACDATSVLLDFFGIDQRCR